MSMAHSLELRVQFLDKKIMELAEQIPTRYRVTKTETKYAMRLAALRACPPQTAKKDKLGFPVPTRVWLKEDKYYNIVKESFLSEASESFFNTDQLVKLLDEHRVYNSIVTETGASTATISRVNRSLKDGNDGYNIVFDRLKKKDLLK
jgi:asparagine synthase (glutamine-hydrolysing)